MPTLRDIETELDVRAVVDAFYGGIERDPEIGPFFAPVEMAEHLPRMYAFWSSVVFQTGTYRGRPFDAHLGLEGLAPHHFARWLERFAATVDAHFRGPRAEMMKARSQQIASIFQMKLGLWQQTEWGVDSGA